MSLWRTENGTKYLRSDYVKEIFNVKYVIFSYVIKKTKAIRREFNILIIRSCKTRFAILLQLVLIPLLHRKL